jgi:hypothetical protein
MFAGTQDHEMSFAVPSPRFESVVDGMNYVREKGAYRYPVPSLALLAHPKIPKEYLRIDPDYRDPGIRNEK